MAQHILNDLYSVQVIGSSSETSEILVEEGQFVVDIGAKGKIIQNQETIAFENVDPGTYDGVKIKIDNEGKIDTGNYAEFIFDLDEVIEMEVLGSITFNANELKMEIPDEG